MSSPSIPRADLLNAFLTALNTTNLETVDKLNDSVFIPIAKEVNLTWSIQRQWLKAIWKINQNNIRTDVIQLYNESRQSSGEDNLRIISEVTDDPVRKRPQCCLYNAGTYMSKGIKKDTINKQSRSDHSVSSPSSIIVQSSSGYHPLSYIFPDEPMPSSFINNKNAIVDHDYCQLPGLDIAKRDERQQQLSCFILDIPDNSVAREVLRESNTNIVKTVVEVPKPLSANIESSTLEQGIPQNIADTSFTSIHSRSSAAATELIFESNDTISSLKTPNTVVSESSEDIQYS
ncbi:unnamed protein product, partial [Didymodactylos carnosus]